MTCSISLNVLIVDYVLTPNDDYSMSSEGLDPANHADQMIWLNRQMLVSPEVFLSRLVASRPTKSLTEAERTIIPD